MSTVLALYERGPRAKQPINLDDFIADLMIQEFERKHLTQAEQPAEEEAPISLLERKILRFVPRKSSVVA